MNETQTTKTRRVTGNTLITLVLLAFAASGGTKLAHVPKVVEELARNGFDGSKLYLVAGLEFLSGILFLIPITRSFGLLMVSAYLGGAIATHVQHNQPAFGPAVILTIFWVGAWLRHPEILSSFARREQQRSVEIHGVSGASASAP